MLQRAVVDLRLVEDFPYEDIARMLGRTAGNVAVLLDRAKRNLGRCASS